MEKKNTKRILLSKYFYSQKFVFEEFFLTLSNKVKKTVTTVPLRVITYNANNTMLKYYIKTLISS